ncbi:hypothetical protein KSD_49560 [Ktedonobacter sp. SOSP1-85]|uniref:hypothetical protein n=1 Tax=Ktedonobacter sp. SOSP1-85 TaxID=2778367 RepID=UPI00191686FE|nr:hypothetical protein [Ktedonobacter sp. SOSP1-85]GHO77185.1 hypothetical protein KSD_49560 [Ktedonobacter sp. SOSP1-85]
MEQATFPQEEHIMLFCTCNARNLQQLIDEINDKIEQQPPQSAYFLRYGLTTKAREGFFCILLAAQVPPAFKTALLRQLQHDEDILDYFELPPFPVAGRLDAGTEPPSCSRREKYAERGAKRGE